MVVCGAGNITSLALFLSPMKTFWGIYKLKSTQEFSGLPYVCTLFNCCLWLLYGAPFVKPHSILLLTINGAGFVLEIFYMLSFLTFALKQKKVKIIRLAIAMTVAFVMVVVVTIYALHTYNVRQLLVGTLGVILSIVADASPLSVVGDVIRTKSVKYMPFLVSLFTTLNALVWSAYSIIAKDIFIAVPNGIGFLLGVIQLVVYLIYRSSEPVLRVSTELQKLPEIEMIDDAFDLPMAAANLVIDDQV
ncbi:bidirectional sugar transporter SWEET1a-like [Cryptomeria japonica]|uniref:bidirectional sugar transporter SWEET1a-like n=1 Tax=Cryptomeria japonica TaxID=3369 RepID=UPI0027DA7CE0|nr:bidirectional sugar transporter SWEET1a-like [Cryptomeria japonica]